MIKVKILLAITSRLSTITPSHQLKHSVSAVISRELSNKNSQEKQQYN
jgi:hypothetical protein